MQKVYRYTEQEEARINRELGYTAEQLSRVGWGEQHQYTVGIAELWAAVKRLLNRRCPKCKAKLVKMKELKYVGLRHPPGTTGGDYQKAYEVKRMRVCPKCGREN